MSSTREFDYLINPGARILAERMLNADPECRRQQAPAMFTSLMSRCRQLLVERLMDQLKNKREARRKVALASLADLGPAVAPILIGKLHSAKTEAGKIGVIELLGEIAASLPPAARGRIQVDLMIVQSRTRSEKVATAIAAVSWRLRSIDVAASQQKAAQGSAAGGTASVAQCAAEADA